MSISHYDKEMLIRRISNIENKQCYMDLLDLVHTHDLHYTVNSNGIYCNLATVSDEIIQIMMDTVGHYENRKRLKEKSDNGN